MDELQGGSLYNKIISNGSFNEENAATIAAFFVSIIKYMHKNEVVIRNLRPENIYFEEKDSLDIKLIDLSLARKLEDIVPNEEDVSYEQY